MCLRASRQRYKRVQDTTAEYFVYGGANVVGSFASNGDLNARYLTTGVDENLSMTTGGNTYYYMADGLGSIRNVVNSSESVQNTYDYYAFGNTLGTPTVNVTNPYEYTGRGFEDGSVNTTFYYRNRYYMSALGVFTSRDAMWMDEYRRWGYVQNVPTVFTDPYGVGPLDDFWNWLTGRSGGRKNGAQTPGANIPGTGPQYPGCVTARPPDDRGGSPLPGDEVPLPAGMGIGNTPVSGGGTVPVPNVGPAIVPPNITPDDFIDQERLTPDAEGNYYYKPYGDDRFKMRIHPDLGHKPPVGPHYDVGIKGVRGKWRWYLDGRWELVQ